MALNTEAEAQRAAAAAATAELRDGEAHAAKLRRGRGREKDLAALRDKHATALESGRSAAADADALRDAHKSELSELLEAHDAELARAGQAAREAGRAAAEEAQELLAATEAATARARQDAKTAEENLAEAKALVEGNTHKLEAIQREHDAAMDDKQRRYDAATEEMRKEHAAELDALGTHEDAVAKAVEEALEASPGARDEGEGAGPVPAVGPRDARARVSKMQERRPPFSVAAKDAGSGRRDAHTRLLDAEAKAGRRATSRRGEGDEMARATEETFLFSGRPRRAWERRDQEHRAERRI